MDHESCRIKNLILLYGICLICYAFGLSLFISGFMTINLKKLSHASDDSIPAEPDNVRDEASLLYPEKINSRHNSYERRFSRIVIVVIDAFRADFISLFNAQSNFKLPFIENLIKRGKAIFYLNDVFSPTVTLPRIKTVLTGTVTNFLDVLVNFNAEELTDDNILYQANSKKLRTVFYGDNLWLRLFPSIFHRSEGTHSFFVTDFTEVDNNVTRHLDKELANTDWDILILHYLGVDHIGHAYGPQSSHMPKKLEELDNIIKNIYTSLKQNTFLLPSLIMICGDHGMTPSGSHGGVSKHELLTPLIFINTNNSDHFQLSYSQHVSQVDIAATLSILLGLPIPSNSIGNVITEALHFSGMTPREVLHAVYYNLIQLSEVHELILKRNVLNSNSVQEIVLRHGSWLNFNMNKNHDEADPDYKFLLKAYSSIIADMQQELIGSLNTHNHKLMILGLTIQGISLLFLSMCLFASKQYNTFYHIIFNIAIFPKIKIFVAFGFAVFFCLCYGQTVMQSGCIFVIGISLFTLLRISYCFLKYCIQNISTLTEKLLYVLLVLHIISLFSTSYIEEEHQTWYFISATIFLFYFARNLAMIFMHFRNNDDKMKMCKNSYSSYLTYFFPPNLLQSILQAETDSSRIIAPIIILASHKLFRCWNQTGDKWAHLPDTVDWLNEPQNFKIYYILVTISQLITLHLLRKKCDVAILRIATITTLSIHLYHFHHIFSSWTTLAISKNSIVIVWLVYIQLITIITIPFWKMISNRREKNKPLYSANILMAFINAWILLTMVIGRTHNIPLLAGVLLQEEYLFKITWKTNAHVFTNVICYLIMATNSFFYLGNSNSLSTVDVVTGYTGLMSYDPFLVGTLLSCNTYSTLVTWFLLMYYRILSTNRLKQYGKEFEQDASKDAIYYSLILISYRFLVLTVYCLVIYIQKHHLFVLTVFAPKLFYEVANVVVFVIISFFMMLVSRSKL